MSDDELYSLVPLFIIVATVSYVTLYVIIIVVTS